MARPLRMEYLDAWYHVMNRGRRGEAIFADNRDYAMFTKLPQETSEMWSIRIAAYCLMANHLKSIFEMEAMPRSIFEKFELPQKLRRDTLKEVGLEFGIDNDSTVSSVMERVKKRLENDRCFSRRLNEIAESIQTSQERNDPIPSPRAATYFPPLIAKSAIWSTCNPKAGERILGDDDFVMDVLSEANERMDRRYELKSRGYGIEKLEERVLEIYRIDRECPFGKPA